jgi:hypothetical protein
MCWAESWPYRQEGSQLVVLLACCTVMAGSSGTVTFVFTDIEGCTRLWQADEAAMRSALARHDQLLRKVIADHDAGVFGHGRRSGRRLRVRLGAAAGALAAQQWLAAEPWPTATPLRVRMGLHTGEANWRDGDYFGTVVNRAARLMALSATTARCCADPPPRSWPGCWRSSTTSTRRRKPTSVTFSRCVRVSTSHRQLGFGSGLIKVSIDAIGKTAMAATDPSQIALERLDE